jgi:cytochrome c
MEMVMTLVKLAVVAGVAMLAVSCGKKEEPVMPAAGDQPLNTASADPAATALTPAQKATLVSLPAPFNAGDPDNGRRKFGQCRSCHSITQGGPNMTGPNLWGVVGRKSATEAGYSYSDGLKAAGWTWDAPRLDSWIKSPRAVVPDTKMSFLGIKNDKDRTDVIAYLALQGGK